MNNEYLTVVLPHGPKVLSANASVPKTAKGLQVAAQKKQKAKRTARTLAWALTLQCLGGRKFRPNRYLIRWFYKYGEPPDDDNAVARCKAYLDGAASAMGNTPLTPRRAPVRLSSPMKAASLGGVGRSPSAASSPTKIGRS